MVTKKAFIKQDLDIILPITRAELVLDSTGKPALESEQFVATEAHPGLLIPEEKIKLLKAVTVLDNIPESCTIQLYANNLTPIYPITKAEAILIDNTTLNTYLEQKLTLDERPKKNSNNLVSSGGIFEEIEDVVGAIYTNLKEI